MHRVAGKIHLVSLAYIDPSIVFLGNLYKANTFKLGALKGRSFNFLPFGDFTEYNGALARNRLIGCFYV